MEVRVFDPPTAEAPSFRSVGRVTGSASVSTVERHWTMGNFAITVPSEARHAEKLAVGRLVLIDGAFWGIVDNIDLAGSAEGDMLTVSGRELKGITQDRITLPPAANPVVGAQGYDTATGSTEHVMKHFVRGNLCDAAQPARAVYGLEVAPDLGRGLTEDKYMSRHDLLSDVLTALGEAAGLGYSIMPDLVRHRLVFDVVEGLDHTARQRERKRVIFDLRRRTARCQTYAMSTADSRNVFYATMSGAEFADEALTATYTREGEEEPAGLRRREKHLSISSETPVSGEEYRELQRKALIEAECFRAAESFQCEMIDGPYLYGQDYRVGDLVSVQNQGWGVSMDARLTEVRTDWTSAGMTRTATFGTAPLNVFGRLRRQIQKG